MIILAKAKRKKDGTIDAVAAADIKVVKEQDIDEISRENNGQVLVRFDGDPGEYYDAVSINGEVILSGELKMALAALEDESMFHKCIGGLKIKGGNK